MLDTTRTDVATRKLNRFFARTYYSFAGYLQGTAPWLRPCDAVLWDLVNQIARDHEDFAVRAAHLILARRARLDSCQYPSQFTSCNYLALEYLVGQLIGHQRSLIVEMESCLDDLSHDGEAANLIETAIASQRRRLIALEAALALPHAFESSSSRTASRPRLRLTLRRTCHEHRPP